MWGNRGEAKSGLRPAAGLVLAALLSVGLAHAVAAQSLSDDPPPMPWPATEAAAAASAAIAAARDTRQAEAAAAAVPKAANRETPAAAPQAPEAAAPTPAESAPAEPESAAPAQPAAPRSSDATLIDRLCAKDLRANEEDRLYGLISLTVRDTLGYDKIRITAPVVDEAVQESLDDLIKDCPRIAKADDARRLGMAVETIQRATLARARERAGAEPGKGPPGIERTAAERSEVHTLREINRHLRRPAGMATAADLSEELSSWEIDAWLDGLPPKERALSLFQYASNVTPQEVAHAIGIPVAAVRHDSMLARGRLLSYFREEESGTPPPSASGSAIEYREAGTPLTGLIDVSNDESKSGGPEPSPVAVRINGISSDLYAGWSLLATVTGLPADQSLDIHGPVMLAAGSGDGERRLIVTRAVEITKPSATIRRFLLKAYTIDGENGGVGYRDTLHLVANHIDNPGALRTLGNSQLANIEIARCLWHDYGKAPDPGLCH